MPSATGWVSRHTASPGGCRSRGTLPSASCGRLQVSGSTHGTISNENTNTASAAVQVRSWADGNAQCEKRAHSMKNQQYSGNLKQECKELDSLHPI